jgi:ketosteroid isomerase-like protein
MPPANPSDPSAEKLALLDRFADAWNRHDAAAIGSMMTADCIFDSATGPQREGQRSEGHAAVWAACNALFEAFPDARWVNPRHFVVGERGVSEWTFMATQRDGKKLETAGCDLFTFRDGKIAVKNAFRKNRPAF